MSRTVPIACALSPLPITVIAFQVAGDYPYIFEVLIAFMIAGWIGAGFISIRQTWLKVLVLVIYPVVMLPAMFMAMLVTHGIRGGPF